MADATFTPLIDTFAKSLGITAEVFERRKAYLELDELDAKLLRKYAEPLRSIHCRLMDAFYTHLQQFPHTREFLQNPDVLHRLRQKQQNYFDELISGNFDQTYLHKRLQIGITHQRIGIAPDAYIGAYAKLLSGLLPELMVLLNDKPETCLQLFSAVLKAVFLDINLALESYSYVDKISIQTLKDYAENLVCNIPLGLIVVSENLTVLSANQYLEANFGLPHAIMKDTLLTDYFPGSGLHDRALEVLNTKRPQFGVQLSIQSGKLGLKHVEISLSPIKIIDNSTNELTQPALLIVLEDMTEHDALIVQTRAYDNRVRAILDNVAEGIITIDQYGLIESFNPAAERLFGYHACEIIGKNINLLMPPPYHAQHNAYLQKYNATRERRCLGQGFREVEGVRKDGRIFPMELSISELSTPEKLLYIGMVRDISQRKCDEAEMAKLSLALEHTADLVMITDRGGTIEYVNCGFEATTGYSRSEAVGRRASILKSGIQNKIFYKELWQQVHRGEVFREVFVNRKKNGSLYYEEKTITPLRDHHGEITHFISTGKDITERMRTQKRLQFLAHHDVLTTLPNRLLFMDRIAQGIIHAKRNSSKLALLFLDLDRFKKINDTLGHTIGDHLLKQLSERLKSCLRQYDTVARLSGDEFAVLLQDIHHVDDVLAIANKLLALQNKPFQIDHHELFITTSIGIALYPEDGLDSDSLLKNADTAMYAAKAQGRGSFSFYTANMNAQATMHLQLENELRHALHRNQFNLVFQPQYSVTQPHTIFGVEALMRWQHPTLGSVSPAEFIPLLEDTGIIKPVGDWLIHTACSQFRAWRDAGLYCPRIAINIAPYQLNAADFMDVVLTNLAKYSLPPASLELEITESSLMQDERRAVEVLTKLNEAGIQIAMDDFGTGYSSLSYLRRLPVNTLKIDRAFISQVPHVAGDSELTRAIIAMGHSLKLKVIAEGVETQEQLLFLNEHHCDGVQGFLLGKPMSAEELARKFASVSA